MPKAMMYVGMVHAKIKEPNANVLSIYILSAASVDSYVDIIGKINKLNFKDKGENTILRDMNFLEMSEWKT